MKVFLLWKCCTLQYGEMVKFDTAELVYNFSPNGLSRDCKKAIEFYQKKKKNCVSVLH